MAISAVALGVSLFLPWYSVEGVANLDGDTATFAGGPAGLTTDFTGWATFTLIDLLLFVLAFFTVVAVIRAADPRSISQGLFGEGLVTPVALIVSIVALIRFLNIPGDLEPFGDAIDRAYGAWIGLFATFGILAGSLIAMRNEWIGSRPMPEIEKLPAPPPHGSTPA